MENQQFPKNILLSCGAGLRVNLWWAQEHGPKAPSSSYSQVLAGIHLCAWRTWIPASAPARQSAFSLRSQRDTSAKEALRVDAGMTEAKSQRYCSRFFVFRSSGN